MNGRNPIRSLGRRSRDGSFDGFGARGTKSHVQTVHHYRISGAYWRVAFANPPMNLLNPETILEFQALVGAIETDENLRVVVFESADPDFFFSRYDLARAAETPTAPGPSDVAKQPISSPAAILGRYSAFCASLPASISASARK